MKFKTIFGVMCENIVVTLHDDYGCADGETRKKNVDRHDGDPMFYVQPLSLEILDESK